MDVLARCSPKARLAIIAALVLVVIASLAWTASRLRSHRSAEPKPGIYLYCTACGEVYQPKERLGGNFPRVCDKCGKRAAWYALKCHDCGTTYPWTPAEDRGSVFGSTPPCPKCGGVNVLRLGSESVEGSTRD